MLFSLINERMRNSSGWTPDVFLSFRGTDTREGFTRRLCEALMKKNIQTFKDDLELPKGNEIDSGLRSAIQQSRFAVLIISENYASSRWCLEELALITTNSKCIAFFPVFYQVEESDVINRRGYFGEVFLDKVREVNDETKEDQWIQALSQLATAQTNWVLKDGNNESEENIIIQEIGDNISDMLGHSSINKDFVGIDRRVKGVMELIYLGRESRVLTVGIWGSRGIGKTTIANEVFTRIGHQFEAKAFVPSLREECKKPRGLLGVQEKLYEDLLGSKVKIKDCKVGRNLLWSKLSSIVVLDDVDNPKQLEAIAGKAEEQHDLFPDEQHGRRVIIVITRKKRLLETYGVKKNNIYEVEKLDENEAFHLFCLKALGQNHAKDTDYQEMSKNFVQHADGLPLKLVKLGNSLSGRNRDQWLDELDHLREDPDAYFRELLM